MKNKRILLLILVVALSVSMLAITASAASLDDLTFEFGDILWVTGCAETASGTLWMPENMDWPPMLFIIARL